MQGMQVQVCDRSGAKIRRIAATIRELGEPADWLDDPDDGAWIAADWGAVAAAMDYSVAGLRGVVTRHRRGCGEANAELDAGREFVYARPIGPTIRIRRGALGPVRGVAAELFAAAACMRLRGAVEAEVAGGRNRGWDAVVGGGYEIDAKTARPTTPWEVAFEGGAADGGLTITSGARRVADGVDLVPVSWADTDEVEVAFDNDGALMLRIPHPEDIRPVENELVNALIAANGPKARVVHLPA